MNWWENSPIVEEKNWWDDSPVASLEEDEKERETRLFLEYARRRIAGSPVPNLVAAGAGLAAGIAGPVQRITGFRKKAASTARIARAFEQAAEEEAQRPGKVLPPIIARGLRGTAVTLPTQVIAGVMGGPAGAIGLAAVQEGNQAIFEGREAGLTGTELAKYATTQATVEAVPAMVMQQLGLGGFEGIFGKAINQRITNGVVGGLKRAGIQMLQEIPEEVITELGHNVAAAVTDVDPKAIGLERMGETVANTVVGTLMQMGIATAPGIAWAATGRGDAEMAPGEPQAASSRAEWLARHREKLTVAKEPMVAPGAIQEEVEEALPEDKTVTLTKVEGAKIREDLGLPELPGVGTETYQSVMNEVAETKADEKALTVARNVLAISRPTTTTEHASFVVVAGKLLNERNNITADRAAAVESDNMAAYSEVIRRENENLRDLDILTAAADRASPELGRALSIRKLRLSREKFDIANMLQEMQSMKKSGVRLTGKEKQAAANFADRYAKALKEMAEVETKIEAEEAAEETVVAEKVLSANKPRKEVGRKIREKAIVERENIKKQIRQLGLRVNDVTGVSAEGTYLIGRLGINYIKEGVGTLAEVAERLRSDMPDLDLSQHDVNKALIQKSPKWKAQARSEAKKRESKLLSIARGEVEIENMARGIAEKIKRRAPIDAEIKAMQEKLKKARNEYYYTDIEATKIERAIERINRLQDQLTNGLTNYKADPIIISPELAALHEQARQLRTEIRVDQELIKLRKQMETGNFPEPTTRKKKVVDSRLERKQIELAKLRREKQQMIIAAAPWGGRRIAKEIAYTAIALKATADISFTFRQNIWQVLSHPVRTSKAFVPASKAFFSEYSSEQIANALRNSENAFLYEQSDLGILDAGSPDAQQQSEVFRGRAIEQVPILGAVMKASSRHAVAVGNLVRTSAFDQFIANHPNATPEERKAYANYLNISTGLGNLGKFGAIGKELSAVFFAPRFAISRVQTPLMMYKYFSIPRVRNEIAADMMKFISTGGMVLTLAAMAGADVELFDPDDPDWGKIRFGDTRIDIWGGFQQPARVIARVAMGPLKAEVGFTPLEVLTRFAAFKLAPVITIPHELWTAKTAVGEDTTRMETLAKAIIPLVFEDIWEAWKLGGIPTAAATTALAIPGVGVSTYRDSERVTRKKIKKLKQANKYTEAEELRLKFNQENPKDRIVTVGVK